MENLAIINNVIFKFILEAFYSWVITILFATMSFLLTELPSSEIYPSLLPAIKEGGSLVLTCKSNKATKIRWKKDGDSEISRAKIHEKEGKSVLSIKEVEASDSGNYSCEAQNAAGIRSAHVTINVFGNATRTSHVVLVTGTKFFSPNACAADQFYITSHVWTRDIFPVKQNTRRNRQNIYSDENERR